MIPMRLEEGLKEFAPFTDQLSENLQRKVGPVVRGALPFVQGKTTDELRHALLRLTPLLDKAHQKANAFVIENAISLSSDPVSFIDLQSDVLCLSAFKHYLETEKHQVGLDWPELFASIALAYVGILYSRERHQEVSTEELEAHYQAQLLATSDAEVQQLKREAAAGRLHSYQLLIDNAPMFAMEALGIARNLKIEQIRENAQKRRLQKVHSSRDAKFIESRRWVFTQYQALYDKAKRSGKRLSRRQAAIELEALAPDWVLGPLTTSDPWETFARWIKAYCEGKKMGVDDIPPFND